METAEQRRERLRALREEAASRDVEAAEPAQQQNGADEPVLKFRNYAVKDKQIEHKVIEPAHAPEFEEPTAEPPEAVPAEEILVNVAPKKPNWDLRRDVAKQLEKLERRTQRAMIQIMQEQERLQLEEAGGVQD
eukprot:jgi/Botrbrau1/10854/Bobra.0025s0032.1